MLASRAAALPRISKPLVRPSIQLASKFSSSSIRRCSIHHRSTSFKTSSFLSFLPSAGQVPLNSTIPETNETQSQSLWETIQNSVPDMSSFHNRLSSFLAKATSPRGFGNFFPKNRKGQQSEKKEEDDDAKDQKADNEKGEEKEQDNGKANATDKGDENEKKGQKDPKSGPPSPPSPSDLQKLVAGTGLFLLLSYLWSSTQSSAGDEISFQEFRFRFLEAGKVESLEVGPDKVVRVNLRSDSGDRTHYHFVIGSIDWFEKQMQEIQSSLGIVPRDYIPVKYVGVGNNHLEVFSTLLNIAFMGALVYFLWRGASGAMSGMGGGRNLFSINKSNATVIKPGGKSKVMFKDVAGLDEAKVEVMEFVEFLKHPKKFTRLGAKVPKGALLVGPPGTGKTLLAKAVAGEASVPFFSISGSDFIEMFVGVGPSRVRDLFAQARQTAPCIIFIDEIDAVGRSRSKGGFGGGNDERENTLNQLLVEMDGFSTTEGVVVLAGTNRRDILDSALLRPGRFDRQITIDKPDIRGRIQIFQVHLNPLKIKMDRLDLAKRLSALTPGFSGADIANLCNEAAIIAARSDKKYIELIDFEKAADRIIGGLEKKNSVLKKHERNIVAYHEAGHAVVGWFSEHADPILKVTIVPRGSGALGFAQYLPNEIALYRQDELFDRMVMSLGGRAAEEVFFGKVSTGAADDLKKVTQIAQAQVSVYGMSPALGNVSYYEEGGEKFQKPFSEKTGQMIDEEVRKLATKAYSQAVQVCTEKKEYIESLAQALLKDETLNHDAIVKILGPRPFVNDSYREYLDRMSQEFPGKTETTDATPPPPPTPTDPIPAAA